MPSGSVYIYFDTFSGVTGSFFGSTKNVATFSGSGTSSGSFAGETSASTTGSFSGSGTTSGSFASGSASTGMFSGGGTVGSDMLSAYTSATHHEIYYPLTAFPCAICCMVPESFCLEIKVCGHIHRTRLKRGWDASNPLVWKSCDTGDALAYMVCDETTGELTITVQTVEGNGFVFPPKQPMSVCPFYVEWVDGIDDVPSVRCGPVGSEHIAYLKLYAGSDCGSCTGGNGVTEKTITSEHNDCCVVCTCCALQPGRDRIVVKIDAFGCDFNGAELFLDADINDCVWKVTLPEGLTYPNCPEIYVEAKCIDGHWQTKIITDALVDCDPDTYFHVIKEQCDPFRVESIGTCVAAVA